MRKASTRLPEQGTQTPSPAPDLIPAEPKHQLRTYIGIGPANGGTSGEHSTRRSGSVWGHKLTRPSRSAEAGLAYSD